MFSKLIVPIRKSINQSTTKVLIRSFAESTKKEKVRQFAKVSTLLGVTGIVCYGTYAYATSLSFREISDEKVFIHTPWLLKKLHKWFPMDCYSPFMTRKIKLEEDVKIILADAFTDMDFVKKEGLIREDAIQFMSGVIQKEIPKNFKESLERGDYLTLCIKDFHHPSIEALPGLQRVMSIDEFIAFASAVLSKESISSEELKQRINTLLEEKKIPREKKEACSYEVTALNMNLVRPLINTKYGIDDEIVEEYLIKKEEYDKRQNKRKELEEKKGILEFDINQVNQEIVELENELKNEADNEDIKEDIKDRVNELNEELKTMKTELKEVKNELYYL